MSTVMVLGNFVMTMMKFERRGRVGGGRIGGPETHSLLFVFNYPSPVGTAQPIQGGGQWWVLARARGIGNGGKQRGGIGKGGQEGVTGKGGQEGGIDKGGKEGECIGKCGEDRGIGKGGKNAGVLAKVGKREVLQRVGKSIWVLVRVGKREDVLVWVGKKD